MYTVEGAYTAGEQHDYGQDDYENEVGESRNPVSVVNQHRTSSDSIVIVNENSAVPGHQKVRKSFNSQSSKGIIVGGGSLISPYNQEAAEVAIQQIFQ